MSMLMRAAAIGGLMLAATATAATAQVIEGVGLLVPDFSVVSDYRYDGLSNSNRHEAAQASLYLWRPDKLYAGVFVTTVDFGGGTAPSWELDLYAGRHFDFGKTRVTVEAMATVFPDHTGPGPSYDFVQGKLKAQRVMGPLTLGGSVAYTPSASYGSGDAWTFKTEAGYAATTWLTFNAGYGERLSELGQDRAFWNIGAEAKWKQLTFDLRYVDTDLNRTQCFWTDWCEPAVIGKVTYRPPVVPNGR